MAIKEEPFVNPFRIKKKENGVVIQIVTHKGKTYEKLVRKK